MVAGISIIKGIKHNNLRRLFLLLLLFSDVLYAQPKVSTSGNDTSEVKRLLGIIPQLRKTSRDSALIIANEALQLSNKLNYKRGAAQAVYELAETNRKNKAFAQSEELFLRAERLFAELKNDSMQADCILSISFINTAQGKYNEAEALCRKHIAIFSRMPAQTFGKINMMHFRGMIYGYYILWTNYYYTDRFADGIPLLDTIQLLSKACGIKNLNYYNNKGLTYINLGKPDSGFYYYKEGLRFSINENRKDMIVLFNSNLADLYIQKGQFDEAQECLEKVIAISAADENYRMLAAGYSGMAGLYGLKGNYSRAAELYHKSIDLNKLHGYNDAAFNVSKEAGRFYLDAGNLVKAEQYFSEAYQLATLMKNAKFKMLSGLSLGKLCLEKKECKMATVYVIEAKSIAVTHENKKYLAECNMMLAEAMLGAKTNLSENALADSVLILTAQAIAYFETDTNKINMAQCFSLSAQASALKGDYGAAIEKFQRSIALYDQLLVRKALYKNYKMLSDVMASAGQPEAALKYYKLYETIKDSLFNETSTRQLNEIETKYDTEKKDKAIIMLNSKNEIASLKLKEQALQLYQRQLESKRMSNQLTMLNQNELIQNLEIEKSKQSLNLKELESKTKTIQLELAEKNQQQQQEEIQSQKRLRNSFIIIAVLIFVIGVFIINRIQIRKKLERQRAILNERKRISIDMHDDLGSSLSKISLLTEVMKQHVSDRDEKEELEKIASSAQDALQRMSEIVWSLSDRNDKLDNLIAYLRKFAMEYFESTSIECKVIIPSVLPDITLSGEQRRNIFLVMKEALHNIIKHAKASQVIITFSTAAGNLSIDIHDNGKGIDPCNSNGFGNGLVNMKQRMQSIGGTFNIQNKNGTLMQLQLHHF